MNIKIITQVTFLVFGLMSISFGLLLIFSRRFFLYWQNKFWKEKNNEHNGHSAQLYNKYTRGIFQIVIGLIFIYFALQING